MPNWSSNCIAVKGKKESIINWLNKGIGEVKLTADMDCVTIQNILNESKLSLDSFNPMPETFKDWDTTNQMECYMNWLCGGYNDGLKKNSPLFSSQDVYKAVTAAAKEKFGEKEYTREQEDEIAKELYPQYVADYEKYCEGWKAAKKYQEETYGVVGWYDWGCKYRGTKWDADLEGWNLNYDGGDDEDTILTFTCETAWNFPDGWLSKMQEDNDDLLFFCRASEEGGFYNGYFAVRENDWAFNADDLYKECKREIDAEIEENGDDVDEDDIEEMVWERMNEKDDEIYYDFMQFVEKYKK